MSGVIRVSADFDSTRRGRIGDCFVRKKVRYCVSPVVSYSNGRLVHYAAGEWCPVCALLCASTEQRGALSGGRHLHASHTLR